MSPCEDWFQASRALVGRLTGPDEDIADEALEMLASQALKASAASLCCLYLPSVGEQWLAEVAAGTNAAAILGTPFTAPPRAWEALKSGFPFNEGARLYLPLATAEELHGCLLLDRGEGGKHFEETEVEHALVLAQQGALALELVGSRQAQDLALLLEERERISRDLHDMGIQDLFATGMMLQKLRGEIEDGLSPRRASLGLKEAMERLDEAVRQIRNIVYRLRDEDDAVGLVDALENEASLARTSLGFAPTLTFEVNDEVALPGSPLLEELRSEAASKVQGKLCRDVVAVVREALTNIARHAHAHSAQVRVSIHGSGVTGEIELVIVDDGSGVDPSHSRNSGLANMLRRATENGGSFAVSSGPRGRGTSLVWRSPLG